MEPCELESGEVIEDRFVGEWQDVSPVVLEAGGMNYDPVVEGGSGGGWEWGSGGGWEWGSGGGWEWGSGGGWEWGSGGGWEWGSGGGWEWGRVGVVEGGSGAVLEDGSGEVVEDGSDGKGFSILHPQLGLEQFCIAPCQMTL